MAVSKQARIGQILILIGMVASLPSLLLSFTIIKGYGMILTIPAIITLIAGLVSLSDTRKNNYETAGLITFLSGLIALFLLDPFILLGSLFCNICPEVGFGRITKIVVSMVIIIIVALWFGVVLALLSY